MILKFLPYSTGSTTCVVLAKRLRGRELVNTVPAEQTQTVTTFLSPLLEVYYFAHVRAKRALSTSVGILGPLRLQWSSLLVGGTFDAVRRRQPLVGSMSSRLFDGGTPGP